MTRYYLEATENIEDMNITPEFVRIDVTDMTQAEQDAVKADIQDVMKGKDYRLVSHKCHHDEGAQEPCESKVEV